MQNTNVVDMSKMIKGITGQKCGGMHKIIEALRATKISG